ncbi:hypothetical protein B7P43_G01794 [Cryptotermes secundus]|uniref:DDE-1 domain-containing protein n=1 Tax=Cryptotermes secundus TaxID=105785 RepID=A0A2J7Q049_9NEOP|nr:hypothetical protein B7P43_G01794 [Cryptotermes secundus]
MQKLHKPSRSVVLKSRLNVMWRSNNKPWVTRDLFTDWINEVFGPSVKKYLLEMNLPLHVLLLMDNALAHPPDLQDDLLEEFKFIKIQFLPPNTTPFLQPMDHQVISNFKKLYTKALFKRCLEVMEGTNLTLREFWKYHFHIVACLKMIEKAWEETLTSAWKKLWPQSVFECDFEGFQIVRVEPAVNEIMSLAKIMGLEVDNNDIDEPVEEHSQELTTKKLMELHYVSQQEVVEESLSEEEEVTAKQESSGAIREC